MGIKTTPFDAADYLDTPEAQSEYLRLCFGPDESIEVSLRYRGHTATIAFDARDGIYFGRVVDVDVAISFHGATPDETIRDFHGAIDHYLSE